MDLDQPFMASRSLGEVCTAENTSSFLKTDTPRNFGQTKNYRLIVVMTTRTNWLSIESRAWYLDARGTHISSYHQERKSRAA